MYKSAFCTFGGFSYVVSWRMNNQDCSVEIRNRDNARKLCADLNRDKKHKASCFKINCATGEKIQKIA